LSSKYPIEALCKALGVPRSTYYYKPKPKESETNLEDKVRKIFFDNRKSYGTRHIKKELAEQGFHVVSRRKISAIMKKFNLVVRLYD
jgi:hypothetical protein